MIKKIMLLSAIFFFSLVKAETIDIDIPDVTFTESDGYVIPVIDGFELDGTGEEIVLPFKKMFFASEIKKVEILKQHEVDLKMLLRKGSPLYRMIDMKKASPKKKYERKLPSLSKFTFNHRSTFKRDMRQFVFDFYPVIPKGVSKIIKIDKIRVHTKGSAEHSIFPMRNTENGKSLLILTTEYFLKESKEIENYIEAKRADGFNVEIATENTYGGGTLTGRERFMKIRNYLKSVYKNYDFLLIIANPSPNGEEVPMLVTLPCETDEPSYDKVPTDIFYAELTEDLDFDGDGTYGEYEDNITFAFELIVGRIPVYNRRVVDADEILARTVKFIKSKPSDSLNRRKILFPTTISYYENQDGQLYMPKMDGAYVAEYLRNNAVKEPFSSKLLVEHSGKEPSEFAVSEDAITKNSVLSNFNEGYGVVFWMGHGESTFSVRTIYRNDYNKNGHPDSYELDSEVFVDTDTVKKTTNELSFVFQGSCLNGTIETPGSLAYTMLLKTSVGVVGASQVSYGSIFKDYYLGSQDIFSYGAVFTNALVKNNIPAEVLFNTKEVWSDDNVRLTVKHETNYLGDPSLNLNVKACSFDSDCDDQLYCNGLEVCKNGFCEKAAEAIKCEKSENSCEMNVCSEAAKACKIEVKSDGSYCDSSDNLCISGRQCFSGKCEDIDPKDCSYLDSECTMGACDPETGDCQKIPVHEGFSCSTGKFCVKDEVCSKGLCKGKEPDYPEAEICNKMDCSEFDGFVNIPDSSQNWDECTTEDGKNGYCSYGSCLESSYQETKSFSSGCSLLFF